LNIKNINIKDFSLNDNLSNFNAGKIQKRKPRSFDRSVGKSSENKSEVSKMTKEDSVKVSNRGSVTRERIRIEPENKVIAADGSVYDRTAPKGTYVDIEV